MRGCIWGYELGLCRDYIWVCGFVSWLYGLGLAVETSSYPSPIPPPLKPDPTDSS